MRGGGANVKKIYNNYVQKHNRTTVPKPDFIQIEGIFDDAGCWYSYT